MAYHIYMYGSKNLKHHSSLATHFFVVATPVEGTQSFHLSVVDVVKCQQELLCWFAPCLSALDRIKL